MTSIIEESIPEYRVTFVQTSERFKVGDLVLPQWGDAVDCCGRRVPVAGLFIVTAIRQVEGSLPLYYRLEAREVNEGWEYVEASERFFVLA